MRTASCTRRYTAGITRPRCGAELSAYSKFFDEYRQSTASTVVGAVNDTFLQSQGQTQGTQSYGLVVDLFVAYYKSALANP